MSDIKDNLFDTLISFNRIWMGIEQHEHTHSFNESQLVVEIIIRKTYVIGMYAHYEQQQPQIAFQTSAETVHIVHCEPM